MHLYTLDLIFFQRLHAICRMFCIYLRNIIKDHLFMFVKHNIGYSTEFSLKLTFVFANCILFVWSLVFLSKAVKYAE